MPEKKVVTQNPGTDAYYKKKKAATATPFSAVERGIQLKERKQLLESFLERQIREKEKYMSDEDKKKLKKKVATPGG